MRRRLVGGPEFEKMSAAMQNVSFGVMWNLMSLW